MDNWCKIDSLTIRRLSIIWISVLIVSHVIRYISPSSIKDKQPQKLAQLKATITNSWFTELNILFPVFWPQRWFILVTHLNLGLECPLCLNLTFSSYSYALLKYLITLRKSPPSFTVREKECSIVWKRKE